MLNVIAASLLAGFLGTAIMTGSQLIEMRIRNRKASVTPGKAVAKILGIKFGKFSNKNQHRFSDSIHWIYGTAWGLFMIIYMYVMVSWLQAFTIFYAIIWLQGVIVMSALKIAPPFWKWKLSDNVAELIHKAVYSVSVTTIFFLLF